MCFTDIFTHESIRIVSIPLNIYNSYWFSIFSISIDKAPLSVSKLRSNIRNYKIGDATEKPFDTHKINLGIFGSGGAGKSAFINSLYYAISGRM